MATNFQLGELVRITGTFTQNSTLVDPAVVSLIVDVNDTTETVIPSSAIINPSTGIFYYDHDADTAGLVEYRWKSTNPQGAQEAWFTIDRSRMASP